MKSIKTENEFMQMAVDEALYGINQRHGGPFGCTIVKDGKIVGRGHNQVLLKHDPTSHGEMVAIREAGLELGTHDLSGCVLYTTGEPCPMCLCACLWARIDKVYYGCTLEDNANIGFSDELFNVYFGGREKFKPYLEQTDRRACLQLFEYYMQLDGERY